MSSAGDATDDTVSAYAEEARRIGQSAMRDLDAAVTVSDVVKVRVRYLGKGGEFNRLLQKAFGTGGKNKP